MTESVMSLRREIERIEEQVSQHQADIEKLQKTLSELQKRGASANEIKTVESQIGVKKILLEQRRTVLGNFQSRLNRALENLAKRKPRQLITPSNPETPPPKLEFDWQQDVVPAGAVWAMMPKLCRLLLTVLGRLNLENQAELVRQIEAISASWATISRHSQERGALADLRLPSDKPSLGLPEPIFSPAQALACPDQEKESVKKKSNGSRVMEVLYLPRDRRMIVIDPKTGKPIPIAGSDDLHLPEEPTQFVAVLVRLISELTGWSSEQVNNPGTSPRYRFYP